MGGEVDLIVDGGPATGEIPSTVVDVTTPSPELIRPGCVPFDDILREWRSHAG
jgi:L-threonylcarbamoyladenylate synthase